MRTLLVLLLAVGTFQERAQVVSPRSVDATVRAYEIVGISFGMPPTLIRPSSGVATLATPPTGVPLTWSVTILYVDNLGTEYVDSHTDPSAQKLVAALLSGSGSLTARVLQHLIDEKKIPPARITK